MFPIPLDGLDDEVQFIGAVDFARDAVVGAMLHGLGFGEVIEAIDPASTIGLDFW